MNLSALASCPLFAGLSEKELDSLLAPLSFRSRRYEKGETVFHLMDDAEWLSVVLSGSIQAQKIFPSGSAMRMTVGRRGDMLGQAAVFNEQRKYPCELIAQEPSELLLFDRENMLKLLHADERLLERFLSGLATTAYQLQWRLELLSYSGIRQKIAFYLLSQAIRSGRDTVPIPGSVTNWALILNVSRPSLHRELRALEERGVLAVNARVVTLRDKEALRSLLG